MSSMSINNTTDIFEESHEAEEELVELTAEEVLKQLEESWVNERNSPELLEPKTEIVECMLEQVAVMEQNLETLNKGDLRIFVHRMEISRIKFVINSYLRTRLDKIQNNFLYYAKARNSDNPSRLSKQEEEFLESYKQCVGDLFQSLCLTHLQGDVDWSHHKVPEPHLQSAVFIKVLEEFEGLEISDHSGGGRDEAVDLQVGDQRILQYSNISKLLDSGVVKLT
eukprot:TRINITY_DN56605_c0_g1_i1.p1 TRINITY_DN56605_c0_g1~~TRINITY_DN56605_c0_g1_i1.p1  ORF type:complete len:224 (-),score=68.65 TRINITY_DN56605_c0_g1_i1:62-733(-)